MPPQKQTSLPPSPSSASSTQADCVEDDGGEDDGGEDDGKGSKKKPSKSQLSKGQAHRAKDRLVDKVASLTSSLKEMESKVTTQATEMARAREDAEAATTRHADELEALQTKLDGQLGMSKLELKLVREGSRVAPERQSKTVDAVEQAVAMDVKTRTGGGAIQGWYDLGDVHMGGHRRYSF